MAIESTELIVELVKGFVARINDLPQSVVDSDLTVNISNVGELETVTVDNLDDDLVKMILLTEACGKAAVVTRTLEGPGHKSEAFQLLVSVLASTFVMLAYERYDLTVTDGVAVRKRDGVLCLVKPDQEEARRKAMTEMFIAGERARAELKQRYGIDPTENGGDDDGGDKGKGPSVQ